MRLGLPGGPATVLSPNAHFTNVKTIRFCVDTDSSAVGYG